MMLHVLLIQELTQDVEVGDDLCTTSRLLQENAIKNESMWPPNLRNFSCARCKNAQVDKVIFHPISALTSWKL